MAFTFQVTIDASDPYRLASFWAEVLGYELQPPPDGYDTWESFAVANQIPEDDWDKYSALVDPAGEGPRIFIQRVPEPKTAKNRVHLDVNAGAGSEDPHQRRLAVSDTAERLAQLGATRLGEFDEYGSHWIVMQDPEGNEFCVH
ncbi:MAG: VOC family protein [Acidimicrobiia bacterium]